MNTLLSTIDFILAGLVIFGVVQVSNVLYPHHDVLSRRTRQWLHPYTAMDPVLLGAAVVGIHGVLGVLAAVFWMPYTAVLLSVTSFIDAAMVMRTLQRLRHEQGLVFH